MTQFRFVILFFVIAAVASTFFYFSADAEDATAGKTTRPPTAVSVISVSEQAVPLTRELPGRTSAYRIAQVRPQVTGIILKRLFKEGARVEAGTQLYQLDDAQYDVALQRAKATLAEAMAAQLTAQRTLDRYQKLLGTKAISQQGFDDAEVALARASAGVAVAQAATAAAKLDLSYTRVYAPISGYIGKSLVTEGALVTTNQQQPLVTITQLDPIYVDIQRPSTEQLPIRDGAPVSVKLSGSAAIDSYTGEGQLQFSDVLVDESTGAVQLRALFPNPEKRLLPGMFVNARIDLGTKHGILVPQNTVVRDHEGKPFVWRVDSQNLVHRVYVTTARAVQNNWLVTAGLQDGDTIVTEGMHRLADKSPVTPHSAKPDSGAPLTGTR